MTIKIATEKLNDFIPTYNALSEREKFGLARVFNDAIGGKLSPFNSPSPVCVGVIAMEGPNGEIGFLGARRAIAPFVGEVALAGGFLNPNEQPVDAVVREILEETGIALDASSISQNATVKMAHNNNMLMFFQSSEVISYKDFLSASANLASTDGEASELVFIDPNTPLCFPLHQEAVNLAFEERGITPKTEVSKSFKP